MRSELINGFDPVIYRNYNLIDHKIEVIEKRLSGKFKDPAGGLEFIKE